MLHDHDTPFNHVRRIQNYWVVGGWWLVALILPGVFMVSWALVLLNQPTRFHVREKIAAQLAARMLGARDNHREKAKYRNSGSETGAVDTAFLRNGGAFSKSTKPNYLKESVVPNALACVCQHLKPAA